jgi:DNA-binding Lrp family transcriptional regulator
MTPQCALGSGQAQVLAALIRHSGKGPVTYGRLARATGLSRIRVQRIVRTLEAQDLIAVTDAGPVPRVVPLSLEAARVSVGRDYAGANNGLVPATLRTPRDPANTTGGCQHG